MKVLHCALALGILGLVSGASVFGQTNPVWWSGVLRSGDSHANSENYAPANLGQLKNFADQARIHLNDRLAAQGGAGPAIESMVAGWTNPTANNYAPINLGQLKAVADKFYARLDAVGFNSYKSQLIANGYGGTWSTTPSRPWAEPPNPGANYAPANLGQLKILFSFDLTGFALQSTEGGTPGDIDGDGVEDATEGALGLVVGTKDSSLVNLSVSVSVR